MAIKKMIVENFTVFDKLEIEFSGGINVLIGENGLGKTHLLKILYSFCETGGMSWADVFTDEQDRLKTNLFFNLVQILRITEDMTDLLLGLKRDENIPLRLTTVINDKSAAYIADLERSKMTVEMDAVKYEVLQPSIYIPPTDMLSHSKGFLSLYEKYKLPFDKTQKDIVNFAEYPETRRISEIAKKTLDTISAVIDGKVTHENGTFYVVKSNGKKISFSLESEGLKKFALLWRLLRNGTIDNDIVLFWDEPDANINPKLVFTLVDILLELQRNNVQIFVATHDYFFAKCIEIRQTTADSVKFHSLYKNENGVACESYSNFRDLKNNVIVESFDSLLDEVIEKNMGD